MADGSSTNALAATQRAATSAMQPGERLPSTRTLVAQHGVSPVTVARAVAMLAAEGLLVTEPGRGTFVADRRPSVVADTAWQTVALGEARTDGQSLVRLLAVPDTTDISFASGYLPDDLQPTRALLAAATRAVRRPRAWSRPPAAGLPELREAMAAGAGVDAGDVLVVSGGQSGLAAALRGLAPPGAPVLVESPTYPGVLVAARAAGLRPVPVPTDEDGIRPELLADALTRTGARVVYTQPTFANPTGTVLAADRRGAVLEAVRRAGAFLIEDDFARQLAVDVTPPPPLLRDDDHGHVVHLASLSKPAAPSLRIAALIARGPAAARLLATRVSEDFFVARPLQETAVELLASAAWARHLGALRSALRHRRDALVRALDAQVPQLELTRLPRGGLHLWVRLPDGLDDVELAAVARRQELRIEAGRPYFTTEPPASHIRLTYTACAPGDIDEGVRRLARAVEQAGG
jgi:DNA-binding transcriptional MocR family regulator